MVKIFKFVFIGIVFFTFNFAYSNELKIDIIAGNTIEPIKLAIQDFEFDKKVSKNIADEVKNVVINNLKKIGYFSILDKEAYPEFVKLNTMPNFDLWSSINADILIQTKLIKHKNDYKVDFYVWNIKSKEQIEAKALQASIKSVRRLGHIMSDVVYERLTGDIGFFDTQIVFIAETGLIGERSKRMAIIDQDGYNLHYISDNKTFVMSPHFSPNMQTIIFLSYRNDDPMLWTLDMNTGDQQKLGRFNGMNFAPRFSPDGTKVALSIVKNGITNLYEYDLKTYVLKQLTFSGTINTSPSYSPDGRYIAFNSNKSGSQQIHLLDLETLREKRITFGNGRYATPMWSPDGRYIAFTKMNNDTFYIGIMDKNGENERILSGGWFMESPSWAPNSKRLVYYETEKADDNIERISHLRSVDIYGRNIYEIEVPDGINPMEPTWSPKL